MTKMLGSAASQSTCCGVPETRESRRLVVDGVEKSGHGPFVQEHSSRARGVEEQALDRASVVPVLVHRDPVGKVIIPQRPLRSAVGQKSFVVRDARDCLSALLVRLRQPKVLRLGGIVRVFDDVNEQMPLASHRRQSIVQRHLVHGAEILCS